MILEVLFVQRSVCFAWMEGRQVPMMDLTGFRILCRDSWSKLLQFPKHDLDGSPVEGG